MISFHPPPRLFLSSSTAQLEGIFDNRQKYPCIRTQCSDPCKHMQVRKTAQEIKNFPVEKHRLHAKVHTNHCQLRIMRGDYRQCIDEVHLRSPGSEVRCFVIGVRGFVIKHGKVLIADSLPPIFPGRRERDIRLGTNRNH